MEWYKNEENNRRFLLGCFVSGLRYCYGGNINHANIFDMKRLYIIIIIIILLLALLFSL